jgi:hypothetical protein
MFLSVDGGHSWIYSSSIFQGAHHRCFLALIVDALRSTAPAPPRELTVDVFYVDGGCSRISVSTFQGAHHRCFLALMVGALGSVSAPARGLAINVS